MKVCFIVSELFLGKRLGGFGRLVRIVGRELVKRGYDVCVITWSDPDTELPDEVDGMKILSYPYSFTASSTIRHIIDYPRVIPLIKKVNADVYISIDCLVETYIAQKVMPNRKHAIWVQDPFDENDLELLSSVDSNYHFNRLKFWATTALYTTAYDRVDLILTQARCYIPKIRRLFKVSPENVRYLPNPVEYIPPKNSITKSKDPMVCFLGRMDPQKRYWIFFELAKEFPDIEFIAVGKPNLLYEELYRKIAKKYEGLKNLKIMGFVDEKTKSEILARSWIMCLPSIREGLPIAFLEALAHRCALLSSVNPDNIVGRFGYEANNDDFEEGLNALLSNYLWKSKGGAGHEYVQKTHAADRVVTNFIECISKCE